MKKSIVLFIIAHCALCTIHSQTPAVTRDTLLMQDSAIVITTACAPLCSSYARVYTINNKVWLLIRTINAPDSHAVFQEAYFEDNQLKWRDNTPALWDEEGK